MAEYYTLVEQTVTDCESHAKTTDVMTSGSIKFNHLQINLQRGSTSRRLAARGPGTQADRRVRLTSPTATLFLGISCVPGEVVS